MRRDGGSFKLANMAEPTPPPTGAANVATVESFLTALQDQDFDAAADALDERVVYQNVGLPTIRGRRAAMKMLGRMQGRVGFEVKTHRIAADGDRKSVV